VGRSEALLFMAVVEGERGVKGKPRRKSEADEPLLSIITVVRNDENKIERTVRSVIDQSYENIEYIVLDGASSDGTLDIVKRYEALIDRWISEPDTGVYDAMNKAVKIARGDWIYFLGSGDILLDHVVLVARQLKDERTIYYGDVYMPKLHRIFDGRYSNYKLMLRNICHQAIFYPRSVFEKYSFDTRYKIWADYVLNVKCHGDKDFRFVYLPILIAIFNDYEGVSRNRLDDQVAKERKALVRANFSKTLFLLFCLRSNLVGLLEKLGIKELFRSLAGRVAL
jgi:glycosyltransferase involved in cell wall biosynthesis